MQAHNSLPVEVVDFTGHVRLNPVLGTAGDRPLRVDLPRLVATRMFIQGVSGSGKSRTLRRLLEQSHGVVQQIVIDPEDELVTLAECFDYLVFSPDSDIGHLTVDDAEGVADMLFRSGRSAILAIGEFELEEMQEFVARFIDRLMSQPKQSWHHLICAIDEAQLFCPQHDVAESKKAMLNLAARSRKRGICPVIASQRISQVHKGLVAHLDNKLIGLTTLGADIKRAAETLGMQNAEAHALLSDLAPGEFIAFGPAMSQRLVKIKVGEAQSPHGALGALGEHPFVPPMQEGELQNKLQEMSASARRAAAERAAATRPTSAAQGSGARVDERLATLRFAAIEPLLADGARRYGAVRARAGALQVTEAALHRWLRTYDASQGVVSLRPRRLPASAADELQVLERTLGRAAADIEPSAEQGDCLRFSA